MVFVEFGVGRSKKVTMKVVAKGKFNLDSAVEHRNNGE